MKESVLGVFCLLSFVWSAQVRVDPLVLINGQGLVRGHRASDGDYSAFLGIPYARVDSDNPFGASLVPEVFDDLVYNANDGSVRCPQQSSDGSTSLDCLKLNIYVPNIASSSNPLPVLFWIHGGEFNSGSGYDYSGVRNLVRHDIVVVTFNYRLGPYGFMCLDIPSLPGNQGLRDQFEALRWVRRNIGSFGGNPYNVTMAGQDAGATSALLQLFSNTDKLFHKVIIQSGTPQSESLFVNGDHEAAVKIAEYLGFDVFDNEVALEYLENVDHNLVTEAAVNLNLNLKPCRERSFSGISNFVDNDPYSLTNTRKARNTPILIGFTNREYNFLSSNYFDSNPFYEKVSSNFNLDEDEAQQAAMFLKNFYIGDEPVSESVRLSLEDFESDFDFNHPTQRTIDHLLRENVQVIYEYMFNYVGESGADGAGHSTELNYLFNLSNEHISDENQLIIDRITFLWSNFIKYGNPTPEVTELVPIVWPPVSGDSRPSFVIDSELRVENRVYNQRMAFWDLFYNIYGSYNKIIRECSVDMRNL